MILFIALPIISVAIQSLFVEHEQVMREVENCGPFKCETVLQVDTEATAKLNDEAPLGRFNGLGTYTNRAHLAFDEIGEIWSRAEGFGDFIVKVYNLPFYKALFFTLTYTFIVTPFVIVLGLFIALGVNRLPKTAKGPTIFASLLPMIVTPLIVVVMQVLSRALRRASRRAMEEMSQLYGMLNDAFSGIRVVKAFNTQGFERAKFSRGINAYYRKSMKVAFYNTLARSSSEMLGMTVVCLAILAGGYLVVNGQTTLFGLRMSSRPLREGDVLHFFGFLIGASDPARKLTDVWSGLQRGIAATTRVCEVIDQPVRVIEPSVSQPTERPHRVIQFDNVSYQYPSGPMVLRGVNLTIRHGETIAVVGPNGCGKSTLVSLLCRFDDPQNGQILLDSTPLDRLRTRDLRKRIALVTQRTILFDDTIQNNILYGSPGATPSDAIRAAKLAFADEFIRRKTPDGYQTMLGNQGMRLSGGQMQRLALARAFLRNPDILILDEATSQVDLESEQLIHQALGKFLVDRTGVMITHRPTSLAMADRIVVIESGQVADSGRHDDLINRNRFYQSLCGNDLRKSA